MDTTNRGRVEQVVMAGLVAMEQSVPHITTTELMSAILTLTWRGATALLDVSALADREANRQQIQSGLERILLDITALDKSKVN